jgi:hypothetical protein
MALRHMRSAVLMVLLLAALAHAHEAGAASLQSSSWERLGIPDPVDAVMVATLISGLGVFYAIFIKSATEKGKKLLYTVIAAPIILATVYLAGSTVYQNMVSATGGPVHWHADYEVWACGQEYTLADPTGISNKVGTPTVHEHNDNRIHIEGVLLTMDEASLHNFFVQVGGDFDNGSLTIPTNDGVFTWNDGDLCNGKPGKWYVFVNGELVDDGPDHIIAPYTTVPPGDRIKIVFTEKKPSDIDPEIGGGAP